MPAWVLTIFFSLSLVGTLFEEFVPLHCLFIYLSLPLDYEISVFSDAWHSFWHLTYWTKDDKNSYCTSLEKITQRKIIKTKDKKIHLYLCHMTHNRKSFTESALHFSIIWEHKVVIGTVALAIIGIPAQKVSLASQGLCQTRRGVLTRCTGEQVGNLSLFQTSLGFMALIKCKQKIYNLPSCGGCSAFQKSELHSQFRMVEVASG